MVIPKKFQLMGHTFDVIHVEGMIRDPDDDELCRGLCQFSELKLHVNTAQVPSMTSHTFMHELMHAVLWTIGHPLAADENFVDAVAGGLAQALDSVE